MKMVHYQRAASREKCVLSLALLFACIVVIVAILFIYLVNHNSILRLSMCILFTLIMRVTDVWSHKWAPMISLFSCKQTKCLPANSKLPAIHRHVKYRAVVELSKSVELRAVPISVGRLRGEVRYKKRKYFLRYLEWGLRPVQLPRVLGEGRQTTSKKNWKSPANEGLNRWSFKFTNALANHTFREVPYQN